MVYDDGFGVGLDPTTTLRMMSIDLDLDELTQKTLPEYQSMDKIKWSFQPLLDIKKKRGFNLAIKLSQRHIRLNAWESVFDILRPILLAYEGEGANVSILWAYDDGEDNSWYSEKINFGEGLQTTLRELTRQKPIRGWKKSLIKSLDEVSLIPTEPLFKVNDPFFIRKALL